MKLKLKQEGFFCLNTKIQVLMVIATKNENLTTETLLLIEKSG